MAALNHIDIFLEFEPIVKLVCHNTECKYNLINATNESGREEAACNLKQITIGVEGQCLNFEVRNDTRS